MYRKSGASTQGPQPSGRGFGMGRKQPPLQGAQAQPPAQKPYSASVKMGRNFRGQAAQQMLGGAEV